MFKTLFIMAVFAGLVSCKRGAYKSHTGFILGGDQIVPLTTDEKDDKVARLAASTVILATKLSSGRRKFCSGFVYESNIADDRHYRIFTNYHCFADTNDDGVVNEEFIPEACKETSVYFGLTIDASSDASERRCDVGSLIGDYTGDLAIFSLSEEAPEGVEPLTFWEEEDIAEDRRAMIIHHPDIDDNYAEAGGTGVSLPSAAVTNDDCYTKGAFAVEEWPLDHALPFSVKHSCDLIHGSSGSALIDYDTEKVLGVNWGGIDIRFKENNERVNAATRADYVLAFLERKQAAFQQRSEKLAQDAEARRQEEQEKKKKLSAKELAGSLCGTITGRPTAPWAILALILLPLSLIFLTPRAPARQRSRRL